MGLDYAAMITDLEAKKAAIEASIASLRLAAGQELVARAHEGTSSSLNDIPVELPVGAFLNMSLPAAIKLFLSATKRKQSIREIATALKNGGVESLSGSFESVVTGALNRLKNSDPPEVLRFPDGWALAELYPESLRNRLAAQKSGKAKKKGKAKRSKVVRSAPEPTPNAPRPEMIVQQFFAHNLGDFGTGDVAKGTGLTSQTVGLLASKLVKRGILEKTPEGRYRTIKIQQMPKAG